MIRPLDELEVALYHVAGTKNLDLRQQLERDERGLLRATDMLLPDDHSELLLVIDQFEEVFTLLDDESQRQHFLNLLYVATTNRRSRVRVIVTLRADYYDRPLQYAEFGDLIRDRVETVLPLNAEELAQTISEPANHQGVIFEDALVSRRELPQPIAGVEYDWRVVANSALYEIVHYMYFNTSEENFDKMEVLYNEWHIALSEDVEPAVMEASLTQGWVVANAVLIWSLTDGGYQGQLTNFSSSYTPPTGEGLWVPTPRPNGDPLPALQPYWDDNRTFVVNKDEQCMLEPPPAYSEDEGTSFYTEAYEVYETVQNLNAEQNEIALFWADDPGTTPTPPGHSTSITNQVLRQENASLALAAEAYAKLGISQADAFILGWYYKYHYHLIRPVTYIQNVIDPDWNTPAITDPVVTPPFPEYPSGHSVQSGATAQVLTDLFGENYAFTDHTHDARGLAPRSFESFYAFADEAAISCLYGGIHFRAAIELGAENGKCIGSVVSNIRFESHQ